MLGDHPRALALRALSRALPRPALPSRFHRLLILRPDHLGDLLLSWPAVAALRVALPDAQLALLVGPWGEEIARRGPRVDEIISCPFPGFARGPKRSPLAPYQ